MRAVFRERSKWLPPPPPARCGVRVRPPGTAWSAVLVGLVGVAGGEQRVAGGGALRRDGADDVLEGDFLVREGVEDDLADVGDVVGEGGGGIDADAQGQGVDEEPDQAGGVGVVAARRPGCRW